MLFLSRKKCSGLFGRNELRDAYRFALGDYAHKRYVHYTLWSSMVVSTDNRHSVVLFQPDGTFDENIMHLTDFLTISLNWQALRN